MGQYVSIRHNGSLAATPTPWLFLGILLPSAAFLGALWLQPWIPVSRLVQEGAVSMVEALLWVGTAAICLFTALMAHASHADSSRATFLLTAGFVTLWLGLNDVLLIHKQILPSFGMSADATSVLYAIVAAIYLLASWRLILSSPRVSLLTASFLLLAASMSVDELMQAETPYRLFLQQGLTFLGIAFWTGFHIVTAAATVEELATGRVVTVDLSYGGIRRKFA